MRGIWMACLAAGVFAVSDNAELTVPSAGIAFLDVTLVSVDSGRVIPGRTVLVEGDRISWVGPNREAKLPAGTNRVEGTGLFLTAGLVDMHVHADPDALGLYLANGITTIRDLNGDTSRIRIRGAIEAGEQDGPTMIVSGPLLAGESQRWRHKLISSAAEGRDEVIREARLGVDLVKVYDGLSQEAYEGIVSAADSLGLPVTGHVSRAIGLATVLSHRQNIEHATSIIDATVGHSGDTVALDAALDQIAEAGIWVTPTLAAFEALTLTGDSSIWARFDATELQYVEPAIREWWRSLRRGPSAPGVSPRARARWDMLQRVVRGLASRGVPMLAGTDDPNPLMVPGFALHEELRVLEGTGLSRRDVLAMATLRPAEFMGTPGEFGTIRAGARADLILLNQNPLDNLAALRRPSGVMARGRWYPRARLDELQAEVSRRYE